MRQRASRRNLSVTHHTERAAEEVAVTSTPVPRRVDDMDLNAARHRRTAQPVDPLLPTTNRCEGDALRSTRCGIMNP